MAWGVVPLLRMRSVSDRSTTLAAGHDRHAGCGCGPLDDHVGEFAGADRASRPSGVSRLAGEDRRRHGRWAKDADADALVDVGCGQPFSQADRGVLGHRVGMVSKITSRAAADATLNVRARPCRACRRTGRPTSLPRQRRVELYITGHTLLVDGGWSEAGSKSRSGAPCARRYSAPSVGRGPARSPRPGRTPRYRATPTAGSRLCRTGKSTG
jgi:hypothetical protein